MEGKLKGSMLKGLYSSCVFFMELCLKFLRLLQEFYHSQLGLP
ncbi:hypothetical protein IC575_004835 [Cucumis melo]